MAQNSQTLSYQSFLLRCWLARPAVGDEPAQWRFSLRQVAAEPQEYAFGTLAELVDSLNLTLEEAANETAA